MQTISIDRVFEIYAEQKPNIYWEIGRELWPHLRHMKDGDGRYLVVSDGDGELTGPPPVFLWHPFKIVDGDGLRLVTEVRGPQA